MLEEAADGPRNREDKDVDESLIRVPMLDPWSRNLHPLEPYEDISWGSIRVIMGLYI